MAFEELNTNFYTEKSVLDILQLIQWKRELKKYNFKTLPKTVILTLDKCFIDKKTRFFSKKIKGIIGFHYQVNDKLLLSTGFGNGAPAIIGLLEELRGLGVENFIFIGFAGSLDANFVEGDICVVKKAYSTTGCSALYSKNEFFETKKSDWFLNLESKFNYKKSFCWSTDAPFRETPSLINHFIEKKATHVDMESAAIYAFAEFYNLNAICILVTSDTLSETKWNLPKKVKLLHLKIRVIINFILKNL